MHEVKSSAVAEIGYSAKSRELVVLFSNGPTSYVYVNVPFYVVGAIFRSRSKGRALHRHVLGKAEFRRELSA